MRKAQLEITDLREQLRAQKINFHELEQKYKALKTKSHNEKSQSKGKGSTSPNNEDLISIHASRFGVMNEMFVPMDIFLQPRPQHIYSDDLDRWDDDEKTKNCIIAELYEELPAGLHEMLEKTSSFRDAVCCWFF